MSDKIDDLDYKILRLLMQDAKVPYTDIAKQLFVSSGTVHVRMKKLETMGIVTGSQILVDHVRLGYDISAFLGIYLKESSLFKQVIEDLKQIPEIVSAHYTTGVYSIFARVICRDTEHLRKVLSEKVQGIQGIQRTETFISLQENINRPLYIEDKMKNRIPKPTD